MFSKRVEESMRIRETKSLQEKLEKEKKKNLRTSKMRRQK